MAQQQQQGHDVLAALRTSCATASSAAWLGRSPGGDLVYVARASCVTRADLAAMESACRSVRGVRAVRYEIDCGDRAVRWVVSTDRAARFGSAGAASVVLAEAAALVWSARALGWV